MQHNCTQQKGIQHNDMLHYATQHTSKKVTLGIAVKQRSAECYSLIQQAMFVILDCMLGVMVSRANAIKPLGP